MAVIWFKRITNAHGAPLTLVVKDSGRPSVLLHWGRGVSLPDDGHGQAADFDGDRRVQMGHRIVLSPGGSIGVDDFGVPWADSGVMTVMAGDKTAFTFKVGPSPKDAYNDYITLSSPSGGTVYLPVGGRGWFPSFEYELDLQDKPVLRPMGGFDPGPQVMAFLANVVGPWILAQIAKAIAGGGKAGAAEALAAPEVAPMTWAEHLAASPTPGPSARDKTA